MRIQSPISNLRDVLAQVKSSANSSRAALCGNEAATRAALIDPVLRALGWDTANVYMVEVEKTLGQTRAGYALYDNGGDVKVIIEAKKLGDNLAQHDVKLVNYAFTFKLTSIILTDGLSWLHYTNFNPAMFRATRVLNLAHDDLGEIASYLVQHLDAARLWPEDQTADTLSQQIEQLQSDVRTLQQELTALRPPLKKESDSAPHQPPAPDLPETRHASDSTWTPLVDVNTKANLKPKKIRLPDGEELSITSWKQILVEAVKYVLKRSTSVSVPLPDRSGKKVCLLNSAALPDNISQMPLPYNGGTVYLYTNYDSNNCISNALYILNQVPADQKPVAPAVLLG